MRRSLSLLALALLLAACTTGPATDDGLGACIATETLKEGDRLPSCSFRSLTGSDVVELEDLAGTPTILNFWASWCIACLKEMPELDRFQDEHPELRVLGVDVTGVQGETIEAGRRYFTERVVGYASIADRDGAFYGHFGTVARPIMPLTVFVDAGLIIRARHFGEVTVADLEQITADAFG